MSANQKTYPILIAVCIVALLAAGRIQAQTTTNPYSFPVNQPIPIGGSEAYPVPVTGLPTNAVITNVEAKFDYIAYNGVQNYVSVRFNRGSDPGTSGGAILVSQGSLPAGNPGTYGWISFSNWNGQAVNTNYYFRFSVASGSPYTATINTIYVRVTYVVPPNPPSLSSPSDYSIFNRNQTSSITFQWNSVPGATSYWLYVFPSGNSGNPMFNGSVGNVTSYALSISGWSNGEYIWLVRAGNAAGWGDYSASRRFIADTPPLAPTISAPAPGSSFVIGSSTNFSWSGPSGVAIARYYLRIVPGSNLNGDPVYHTELTGTNQNVNFIAPPFAAGSHIWSVRAIKVTPPGYNPSTYESTIGWGAYAPTRTLTITEPIPGPPSLISPSDYSIYRRDVTGSISFQWSSVSGALEYWLNIFPSGNSSSPVFDGSVGNVTNYSLNPASWTNNVYVWQVKVRTGGGWSVYSGSRQFIADTPPPAPTLSTPEPGASFGLGGSTSFSWTPPQGVAIARYYLRIVPGSDLNGTPVFDPELTNTSQGVIFNSPLYNTGSHIWGVRAIKVTPPGYNQLTYETTIGWGQYSTRTFSLSNVNPQVSVDPTSGPINTNFYEPGTGFTPNNFAELHFRHPDGSLTSTVLKDTDASGNYDHYWLASPGAQIGQYEYWAVDLATGVTSNTFTFTVTGGPQLLTPSENQTVTSNEILFSWSDVNAVRYELYVDNAPGLGSPEISKQHIEELQNYTQTSYTISGNWLNQNVYYWRVFAFFPDGSHSVSQLGSFTYTPPTAPAPQWVPVYRLYKSSDKDHFYCTNENHKQTAISAGYLEEGVEGYVSAKPFNDPDMVPIFRFYKGDPATTHYYTADGTDRDLKIIENFTYEGIVGFAYNSPAPELVPLYHLHKDDFPNLPGNVDHFYTISWGERDAAIQVHGFVPYGDGITAYVSPNNGDISEPVTISQLLIGLGINAQNGNFSFPMRTSFNIPGKGTPLTFTHIYNSLGGMLLTEREPLSPGWSHSYNAYVVAAEPTAVQTLVTVHWPDGSRHEYYKNGSAYTILTEGVYDDFEEVSFPLHFRVTKKDQTVYDFQIPVGARWGSPALLSTIKDRNNNTITCQYTAVNPDTVNLTKVIGTCGRELNFTYYSEAGKRHLIQSVTDPIMRSIQFEYANSLRLVRFIDAENYQTQFEYDTKYDLLNKIVLPRGNITTIENEYDTTRIGNSVLKVLRSQRLNNSSNPLTITAYGDLINNPNTLIEDPNQNHWTIVSESNFRLLNEIRSDVFGTVYKVDIWDSNHPLLPQQISDGRGYTTTFTYDSKGNILDINRPENADHHFQYNFRNDVTHYTNPRDKVTSYNYNGNGNLTSVTDPRGTTTFTRTSFGKIETVTNPLGHTYTLGYDNNGILQSISDPLSNITNFYYDGASRLESVTNAENQTTQYDYNARDLLTTITDALLNPTNFTYDANGNLTRIVNARGGPTDLGYDNQDRLESFSNPGQSPTTYNYENDNISSRKNPDNSTTNYTYDDMSRLKTVSSPNVNVTFSYDMNNNIISVSQPGIGNGSMSFSPYDGLNRITQYTDFYGNTVQYGYDANSNITSITYPGNKTVYYTYYDDDRLWTVKDWNNNITTYTYRGDGSLNTISYPNGVTCTYNYDGAGQVEGKTITKSGGTIIASYSFELDKLGNHTRETIQEPLSLPVIPAAGISYNYDIGNRIQNANDIAFGFDPNGNMTSRTQGGITTNYAYDSEHRLTGISGPDNAAYVYDIFGNRREATRNAVITRYVLDINGPMSQVLMETDGNNNPKYYYIYGLGLIARIAANGVTTRYYHSDFRGSTIAMTDQNANITHKYAYDAFGKVLDQVEEDFNPFRYVGTFGVMDEQNGLYFMRARYYDPLIGRFLSEDPVWDVNLYDYANSNPVINIDPLGKFSEKAEKRRLLLQQLQFYQRQSAYYEQRELKQEQYQIIAGLISDISGVFHPAIALTNASTGLVASIAYGDSRGAAKYTFNALIAKYSWTSHAIINNLNLSTKVSGISKAVSDLSFFGIERLSNWFWDKRYKK